MAASTKSVADRYEHLLKSGEHEVPAMQVDSSLHFDDILRTLLLNKRSSADSIFHVEVVLLTRIDIRNSQAKLLSLFHWQGLTCADSMHLYLIM